MNSPEVGLADSMKTTVKCPPALRCLVFLWEQINLNCIQFVEHNASNASQSNAVKESAIVDDSNIEEPEPKALDAGKSCKFPRCYSVEAPNSWKNYNKCFVCPRR